MSGVDEDRWQILASMLTEFPGLRRRALHLILDLRPELEADAKKAIFRAFIPVHIALGVALEKLGKVGLKGEARYSAERGCLLVLLEPAPEEEAKRGDG